MHQARCMSFVPSRSSSSTAGSNLTELAKSTTVSAASAQNLRLPHMIDGIAHQGLVCDDWERFLRGMRKRQLIPEEAVAQLVTRNRLWLRMQAPSPVKATTLRR